MYTVIAVTRQLIILLRPDGQRERIHTQEKAALEKGATLTEEQVAALR
jgi:hypothetical protein